MREGPLQGDCAEPDLRRFLAAYCYRDLSTPEHDRFTAHLLECDACWDEVRRLEAAVAALRAQRHDHRAAILRDLEILTGPSSRLEEPLGGHGIVLVCLALFFGLLSGLAFLTEFVYSYEVLGIAGVLLAGGVAAWAAGGALVLFWVAWRREAAARPGSAALLAGGLIAVTALAACAVFALPSRPLIDASFQTYPAPLGYVKTLFWTVFPALVLLPLPVGIVAVLTRELKAGRHKGVLLVVTRHPIGLAPRGHLLLPPAALAIAASALVALDFVGMSHILDALRAGPYMAYFMAARWARFASLSAFVLVALLWYIWALTAIRREALAGASAAPEPQRSVP